MSKYDYVPATPVKKSFRESIEDEGLTLRDHNKKLMHDSWTNFFNREPKTVTSADISRIGNPDDLLNIKPPTLTIEEKTDDEYTIKSYSIIKITNNKIKKRIKAMAQITYYSSKFNQKMTEELEDISDMVYQIQKEVIASDMTPTAKLLYHLFLYDTDGVILKKSLLQELNMSEVTFDTAIRKLKENNFLKLASINKNVYYLYLIKEDDNHVKVFELR